MQVLTSVRFALIIKVFRIALHREEKMPERGRGRGVRLGDSRHRLCDDDNVLTNRINRAVQKSKNPLRRLE